MFPYKYKRDVKINILKNVNIKSYWSIDNSATEILTSTVIMWVKTRLDCLSTMTDG